MKFPQRQGLPANTGSTTALTTALGWLNHCVFNHPKCSHLADFQGFRPTRLVDIGKYPGKFCVVPGNEAPPNEQYVTLSHRWGSVQDILLTRENENQLAFGLSIEDLSQTFQDAVFVARFIGVRFLWIDCLCIIQEGDNGKDWESESGRMNLVYRYAYCNISADHASDNEGLFFERDPDFYCQARIQTLVDSGGDIADWTSIDKNMWLTQVNNSPLNSRGWVFQERMLAPRIIHFCHQEIFWECREHFYCESFPEALPSPAVFDLGETFSLRKLPSELWEGSEWFGDENFPIKDMPYEVWDDIIKAYTKCQFTYPSDKLVAISGVAQYTKTVIKDAYLAGMWKERLSAELAWWMYPDRDRYVLGEEPPYYAPSFSWASVKGQINSSGPYAIGILVDVQCVSLTSGPHNHGEDELFTGDCFGAPLRSPAFQLRVTGKLRSVKMHKRENWRLFISILAPVANRGEKEPATPSDALSVELEPWLDFRISASDRDRFEAETFYLMYWRHGPEAGDYDMREAALHCILLRLVDEARDQFRRIGWVIADEPDMGLMLRDETRELLPGNFNEEKRRHTIYLV